MMMLTGVFFVGTGYVTSPTTQLTRLKASLASALNNDADWGFCCLYCQCHILIIRLMDSKTSLTSTTYNGVDKNLPVGTAYFTSSIT